MGPADLAAIVAALPPTTGLAVLRDGPSWIVAVEPEELKTASGTDAFTVLEQLDGGFWAGFVAYELGRVIEPTRPRPRPALVPNLPDLMLARFATRLVLDPVRQRVELLGYGPGRALLEAALGHADAGRGRRLPHPARRGWTSGTSRAEYEDAVRAVLELLRAGECYQVNLTRQLTRPGAIDPAALWAALIRDNPSPHSVLLRLGDIAVVSASPERFLRVDGDVVETRPIKGTGVDPAALGQSPKDRAENVMIVDLARNDLGRVCRFGSVEVAGLCELERHPGLYHLVSTVRGTLRDGVGAAPLLRATFPPASVTGAPKPRVLQAIEDLEPTDRGVYCGAVGWIDADRACLDLSVAIRTFTIAGGATHLGVGAGIVADSDPAAEWQETELKAARLLRIAGAVQAPSRSGPPMAARTPSAV